MQQRKTETGFFLRFEKGEDIVATLTKFLGREKIGFGSLQGIGALDEAELGFYDTSRQIYLRREFAEDFEIASLMGNVSLVDGKPFAHIHVTLSDPEFRVVGGHLFYGRVSVTCEMDLRVHTGEVHRKDEDGSALKLMDLQDQ
ncbi:DNA-binding protein [bacterium]|nr:DNA-binding protein [bacterium]